MAFLKSRHDYRKTCIRIDILRKRRKNGKRKEKSYRPDIPAYLILEDGTVIEGYSLGAKGTTFGEVVFSTAMTGYQEALTDLSYYGQIVIQTFPLIGNYGVNDMDKESSRVWLSGYIIREWCYEPV